MIGQIIMTLGAIAALIILALALWVIAEAIILRVGGVGRD